MRIILGIGNPGPEYVGTRHNVGFLVLDRMARELRLAFEPAPGPVLVARGQDEGGPFLLVKPQGYVNRSGEALLGFLGPERPDSARVLVVLDDLALPLGALRLRARGSAGGHHGLRSVLAAIGSEAVPRLRVGIGGAKAEEWREHVLSPFRPEEQGAAEAAAARAAEGAMAFLGGRDFVALQSELNRAFPPADDRGTGSPGAAAPAAPEEPSARRGVVVNRGGSAVEQKKVHKYEGMFLLNNSRVPPEGGGATTVVGDLLKKHGFSVVRADVWDERKLAYAVADQKRGTYVLAHFEGPSTAVTAVNHDVSISEDVLRVLIVRHEKDFPAYRTAAEMAALQPKKDLFGEGRRRRDDDLEEEGGGGGRGRWREGPRDEDGRRGDDFEGPNE